MTAVGDNIAAMISGAAGDTTIRASPPPTSPITPTSPDGWLCRSCACILRVPYKYPPSPWVYCARGGCAMTPDEQLVALARLQQRVDAPAPVVETSGDAIGEVLSIPEAARLLRRSVKGVYRLAAVGELPGASKMGGRWVVSRATLLQSVREGRVPPRRFRR